MAPKIEKQKGSIRVFAHIGGGHDFHFMLHDLELYLYSEVCHFDAHFFDKILIDVIIFFLTKIRIWTKYQKKDMGSAHTFNTW